MAPVRPPRPRSRCVAGGNVVVLVDTNVINEFMRPAPSPRVVAWAGRVHRFHVSVVTVDEIWFGLAARPNKHLEEWFASLISRRCDVLPTTHAIAEWSGRTRGRLRARGVQRSHADMLIAGTAHEHGLELATRNVRDFAGCGVRLVNPFA